MILAIRTDKPEAELYLLEQDGSKAGQKIWHAHRELSTTILNEIDSLLKNNELNFDGLRGIIVYHGPGSYTGLRIGITVANTLAYSLNLRIVGSAEESWIKTGLELLINAEPGRYVQPEYGGEAHITTPKK